MLLKKFFMLKFRSFAKRLYRSRVVGAALNDSVPFYFRYVQCVCPRAPTAGFAARDLAAKRSIWSQFPFPCVPGRARRSSRRLFLPTKRNLMHGPIEREGEG